MEFSWNSPLGMEFIPRGQKSTPWGQNSPLGAGIDPPGQQGEAALPPWNPDQQGKLNHLESYFLFCFFPFFWEGVPASPSHLPGALRGSQGGEEMVVVDIPSPCPLCSPFPSPPLQLHLEFHPQLKDLPRNQGGVPSTAPNSQMSPPCRATPGVP